MNDSPLHDDEQYCIECGARTKVRVVNVGYALRVLGLQIRLGPHHERRCPHYRKEVIPE